MVVDESSYLWGYWCRCQPGSSARTDGGIPFAVKMMMMILIALVLLGVVIVVDVLHFLGAF
ncbi:hypothetical protein BRC89_05035 [Halobacteriales archaeon QS_4_70_19]|nr:MAG: hypothetical protein BRC89_05035 [Halobacteriales archaeon QS_4_70_19]